MTTRTDVLITDLGCAFPREAWTDADATTFNPIPRKPAGGWRVIEYQSDLYSGRFLQSHDPKSAVLTIPLNLSGWHAVSIGFAATGVKPPQVCGIEVRLSGGRWQLLRTGIWDGIREEPWIMADLTGRALEVRYPRLTGMAKGPEVSLNGVKLGPPAVARLFSVRATPMTAVDARAVADAPKRDGLYGTDGHGVLIGRRPGPGMIRKFFTPFAGGDWNLCFYGGGGPDTALYDTQVGSRFGAEGAWDCDELQRSVARSLRAMIKAGHDPLAIAVGEAHRRRHPIFVYMRGAGWTCEPPLDQIMRSLFYAQHPEYCLRGADGTVIGSYLSIAYDEVRARMNAMLREYLERGADGLALCFVRGFPLVRYEEPVLRRYRERHGGDARDVLPDNPRLREVWAEFVTAWLREVRAIADAAGPSALSPRRKVLIMVGPSPEWCRQFGIDVAGLARAGLVDLVMPYQKGLEFAGDDMTPGVVEFAKLLEGTGVPLLPSLGSSGDHDLSLYDYRKRAHLYYAAGAGGLARWDTDPWLARLALNNAEAQRLWVERYPPPAENRLVSMAGLNRVIFSPRHGV